MRPKEITIVQSADLGLRASDYYLSRYILSDDRIVDSAVKRKDRETIHPHVRMIADRIELKNAGVSEKELDRVLPFRPVL